MRSQREDHLETRHRFDECSSRWNASTDCVHNSGHGVRTSNSRHSLMTRKKKKKEKDHAKSSTKALLYKTRGCLFDTCARGCHQEDAKASTRACLHLHVNTMVVITDAA